MMTEKRTESSILVVVNVCNQPPGSPFADVSKRTPQLQGVVNG